MQHMAFKSRMFLLPIHCATPQCQRSVSIYKLSQSYINKMLHIDYLKPMSPDSKGRKINTNRHRIGKLHVFAMLHCIRIDFTFIVKLWLLWHSKCADSHIFID